MEFKENQARNDGARARLAGLALAAVTLLAYLPAMRAGFIWDDDLLVTGNRLLRSASGLRAIWFSGAATDYTPLTLTSFWLEWRLWGGNAAGYHAVNILLHAAAACVLWRILRKLGIPGAWWGALLFAVHPVNAASVAWIAERKNTLSLLFYLLAILWYLEFNARGAGWRYGLACLAAACAFLSKGSTVILPMILIGCVWWRKGRIGRNDLLAAAPFFALAAAAALVTIHFQSRYAETGSVSVPAAFRVVRAGEAVWFYLWKDIWPRTLCTVYPQWNIRTGSALSYLPALAAALLIVVLWLGRRRWGRAPFAAWSYFLIALLPVLGFVNIGFMDQAYVADWWQQLALIGVTSVAGAALARAAPAAAILALLLAARTWSEAAGYQSMETHCRRTLACNPGAWSARNNLGNVLLAKGKTEEAINQFQEALRLKPDEAMTHFDYGNALKTQGKLDQAAREYREAVRLHPAYAEAHNNLGVTEGATDDAISQYLLAIQYEPDYGDAYHNLGFALEARGRTDEAISQYRQALAIQPDFAEAHFDLGNALMGEGRLDEAITEFREALRFKPNYGAARQNLGNALQGEGKLDDAIAEYRQALRWSPADASTYYNMGGAFQSKGQLNEAIASYSRAVALQPALMQAQWNLGGALLDENRAGDAIPHLEKAAALAGRSDPRMLRSLAAAYAEARRFSDAVTTAREALALAQTNEALAASLRGDITSYQNGTPLRQP